MVFLCFKERNQRLNLLPLPKDLVPIKVPDEGLIFSDEWETTAVHTAVLNKVAS